MTTPRDPEALLTAYLVAGMEVLPDRVVDSVLDEVHRTRQRTVLRPWRTRSMFKPSLAAAAVVAALVSGALLVTRPDQPAVNNPSPTPTVAPSASEPAGPSARPTPSAFAGLTGAWIATGTMGKPRYGHTAVRLLDGRVLVVGGDTGDQNDLSAELYDPSSGTWSATGSMVKPHANGFRATLLHDGKVLVGEDVEPETDPSVSGILGAEVYDPATGTWTVTGKMVSVVREGIPTLLRDGRVLVVHRDSAELYDPETRTWTATGKMITPGLGAGAAVLLPDGKVLVPGGGIYPRMLDAAEVFDPDTGSWTVIASMSAPRDEITATLLGDGTVLVAGPPSSEAFPPTSAELYDPLSGTWSVTGDMGRPDAPNRSATLLLDGTVLVTAQSDPELYDPGSRSWTPFWPMLGRRDEASATLLLDGRVLVAGGLECSTDTGECAATGSAQLYDPGATPIGSPPPTLAPTPVPTPTPTPVPPQEGPIPPNAQTWELTVSNRSFQPATLFVAEQDEQGLLGRLVGSATPNVVPPGATVKVTFLLPAKGTDWAIFVNPGPNEGPIAGPAEMSLPGQIVINPSGQTGWLSP
jgi:hypothetical protein